MFLKHYAGCSDRKLIEQLNGNIHYQIFCDVVIDPLRPITNYKIVSQIRCELALKLDIEIVQKHLAVRWKDGIRPKNRIVSINKPYIRPIVRGKEVKSVEFGAKVNKIQVDGISFIEHLSFDAFNEGTRLKSTIWKTQKLQQTP